MRFVLYSTKWKEQLEWRIPPAISNWKNPKGYTIPLDKRLAADGRGLQSTHINENFAKLAESLYIADRKAREAVEMRAQVEKKMANKEKVRLFFYFFYDWVNTVGTIYS